MIDDFYEYPQKLKKIFLEGMDNPHLGKCIEILENESYRKDLAIGPSKKLLKH